MHTYAKFSRGRKPLSREFPIAVGFDVCFKFVESISWDHAMDNACFQMKKVVSGGPANRTALHGPYRPFGYNPVELSRDGTAFAACCSACWKRTGAPGPGPNGGPRAAGPAHFFPSGSPPAASPQPGASAGSRIHPP